MWILTVTCVVVSGAQAQPTLVGHWKFDEAGGASAADSAGANPGSVVNGASFVPGVSGNAISISKSANQYVTMGNVLPMASGDFAIGAWIKTNSTVPEYFMGRHFATVVAGYMLGINADGPYGTANRSHFYTSDVPGQEAKGTSVVNDNQWHHIMGVYVQGGPSKIYVDGAPVEGSGAANGMVVPNAPFAIGGIEFSGSGVKSVYNGLVDDAQVYEGAVCSWDVQWLFEHPGQGIPQTGLCYADCDANCALQIDDFICFQTGFALGDPQADCDESGTLSIDDFICFQTYYAIGC